MITRIKSFSYLIDALYLRHLNACILHHQLSELKTTERNPDEVIQKRLVSNHEQRQILLSL